MASGKCVCGCGKAVERTFLPGHDQKLLSKIVTAIKAEKKVVLSKESAEYARGRWPKEFRQATGARRAKAKAA